MRRIWLFVILFGIVTIVVLAYTWQNIPYLNTWLIDSGVIAIIQGFKTNITDIANGKMPVSTVVPLLGTAATLAIGALKGSLNWIKREKVSTQIKLTDAQSTIGDVKSMASDLKEKLTGANNKLQEEYSTLNTKYVDLEAEVTMKNAAIIDVQSELGKAQAQVIATQNELKNTIKEMDEYRIALEQKALPTTH